MLARNSESASPPMSNLRLHARATLFIAIASLVLKKKTKADISHQRLPALVTASIAIALKLVSKDQ
jgi:hypothetical protein